MFIVVSLEVISGLGTIILSVTANLNFWSRAIFWTLALPEKCTDPERKSMRTRSVCGFLPGLALMKTTAWKSMRTLLYFRLDTLLTKLPSYFVRHSSVGPQQPWIVYYRIQWSEWVGWGWTSPRVWPAVREKGQYHRHKGGGQNL